MGLLDEYRKREVFEKGAIIAGFDANVWRRDQFGNAIQFSQHGNRNSEYGWEIDHIVAVSLGGSDHMSNLRPLHWRVNAGLGGLLGDWLSNG